MNVKKTLFVMQEMYPYVPESDLSIWGRKMPKITLDSGSEVRTFMPKWGIINERRNQLHEVIRLSGMNLDVNDVDYPLIIKVASIPSDRVQIYFIDNEHFFAKRLMTYDEEGNEYYHNAERAFFYAQGVLETVKKLRWTPDVVHCIGWISSFIPVLIKTRYSQDPTFANCRSVFTPTNLEMSAPIPSSMPSILKHGKIDKENIFKGITDCKTMQIMNRLGLKWSDGVVMFTPDEALGKLAKKNGRPVIAHPSDPAEWPAIYPAFYEKVAGV